MTPGDKDDDYVQDDDYDDISRSDKEVRQLLGVWGVICFVVAGGYHEFGPYLVGPVSVVGAVLGAGFVYLWLWGSDDTCRSTYDFVWNLGRPRKPRWFRR